MSSSDALADNPLEPDAVWRGYHACAERILRVYTLNLHGYQFIADQLNRERWAFRDRWGNPRALKLDDVRRVTSAWREYAGLVLSGKARDRIASKLENPSGVLHDTGRAVFDLELLHAVAKTQEARSIVTRPAGAKREAYIFALSDLLYCIHCEIKATEQGNPKLRSRIIGWKQRDKLRYRHSESRHCGCKRNSVFADEIEDDFARLINALEIIPEAVELMADLAIQSHFDNLDGTDEVDFEEQKKINIARHRRALKNNLMLFQNGDIEDVEYYRQKDHHKRQIAHWEAHITDRQKITLELMHSREMVKRLQQFWDVTTGEDRKLLAHSLFDEIVYDLDRKRIVDFKVKSWAEPFLVLRAALYEDEMGEEMKNRFNSGGSSGGTSGSPNGTRNALCTLFVVVIPGIQVQRVA